MIREETDLPPSFEDKMEDKPIITENFVNEFLTEMIFSE
jgi:hypothetical protein